MSGAILIAADAVRAPGPADAGPPAEPRSEGTAADDPNPFPGPRPFSAGDRTRFFGREAEVPAIGYLILANPVYLLYAGSGAGKSSLVRAGLRPWLEENGAEVCVAGSLRQAVAERQQLPPSAFVALAVEAVSNATGGEGKALRAAPGALLVDHPWLTRPGTRVLFFDQFEDVFEIHPARWAERQALFAQLAIACERFPDLHVVLVVREEFLGKLTSSARFLPGKLDARYHLEPLRSDDAVDAIEKPAARSARAWGPGAARWLVSRLLAGDGASDPASEFVDTTMLQVVCRDLWARAAARPEPLITVDWLTGLDEENGIFQESLARYYRQQLSSAAAAIDPGVGTRAPDEERQRAIAAWIEAALIDRDRRTMHAWSPERPSIGAEALEALKAGHLVHCVHSSGGEQILELAHDRLVAVVREENEALRAAADGWVSYAPDGTIQEESVAQFIENAAYFVCRSMRLKRAQLDEMLTRLAAPGDDPASHAVAEAHFCLEVLEGKIPFARLSPQSYRHLEGTLLDDVKKLRAYLIWEQRLSGGRELENYYAACDRLRARALSARRKLPARELERPRRYLEGAYLTQGAMDPSKPRCRALIEMKARTVWRLTGGRRGAQADWKDASDQIALFFESVVAAVEREDPTSLARLREAMSGARGAARPTLPRAVDCFQAALVMSFVSPGAIQQYGLME